MSYHFIQRFVLIVLTLLVTPVLAWAQTATLSKVAPPDALTRGWITVQRGQTALQASVDMRIQAGDVVLIKDKRASVRLTFPDGQSKWVNLAESPYTFATRQSGWSDSFKRVAQQVGFFNRLPRSDVAATVTRASTGKGARSPELDCGGELNEPVIPADNVKPPVKLVAGERALHFRWIGGMAPYTLTLLQDGKLIQEATVKQGCQVTLPTHDWKPGVYTLVLKDPTSRKIWTDKTLTFVTAETLPAVPAQFKNADLSQAEQQLLYADWLANQSEGAWRLEAVQIVTTFESWDVAREWLGQWGGNQMYPNDAGK